jgi:hypothetical protein
MKPNMVLPRNKIKKKIPMNMKIHATIIHTPFLSKNFFSPNFLKPMITNNAGMKNESPFPAKVAMIAKADYTGMPIVATKTSITYKRRVTE